MFLCCTILNFLSSKSYLEPHGGYQTSFSTGWILFLRRIYCPPQTCPMFHLHMNQETGNCYTLRTFYYSHSSLNMATELQWNYHKANKNAWKLDVFGKKASQLCDLSTRAASWLYLAYVGQERTHLRIENKDNENQQFPHIVNCRSILPIYYFGSYFWL